MALVRRIRAKDSKINLRKIAGGPVFARPFCVDCQHAGKNARGGMFSSARKNAWIRLNLRPIALFYAKKVL